MMPSQTNVSNCSDENRMWLWTGNAGRSAWNKPSFIWYSCMVKTTSTDQRPSRIWSNLVFTIQCLEDADWLMTLQEHVYSPESLTSDWAVTNAMDKEKKLTVYTQTLLFKSMGSLHFFFYKINYFIQQKCIKLIECDSKDTKGFNNK